MLHAQLLISVILVSYYFVHDHSYENVVMSFIKNIDHLSYLNFFFYLILGIPWSKRSKRRTIVYRSFWTSKLQPFFMKPKQITHGNILYVYTHPHPACVNTAAQVAFTASPVNNMCCEVVVTLCVECRPVWENPSVIFNTSCILDNICGFKSSQVGHVWKPLFLNIATHTCKGGK